MRSSELAKKYAKALFELAVDNRSQEKVFSDLRALSEIFAKKKRPAFSEIKLIKSALVIVLLPLWAFSSVVLVGRCL